MMIEKWDSREALAAHAAGPAVKAPNAPWPSPSPNPPP
jgi:quinol monooxygenase YgiN